MADGNELETYEGRPCKRCGGTERFFNGMRCASCTSPKIKRTKWEEKRMLDGASAPSEPLKQRGGKLEQASVNRNEARALGRITYMGKLCPNGHDSGGGLSERYTKGGACLGCHKEYYRGWYDERGGRPETAGYHRQERVIDRRLMRQYGISLADYKAMEDSQGGKCAICGTQESGKRRWHVDHCHTTGKVRGLLCSGCNTGLGAFRDNTDSLLRAVSYLQLSQNEDPC